MNFISAPINWASGWEETLSYKTTVFTARRGRERRVAEREKPRRTFRASMLMHDTTTRNVRSMLTRTAGDVWYIPDFVGLVSVENAAGATTALDVGTMPTWARYGRPVAVKTSTGWEVRTVTTTADGRINLDAEVVLSDHSYVAQAVAAYASETKLVHALPTVSQLSLDLAVVPTTDPLRFDDTTADPDSVASYRGSPVFPFRPNWATDVSFGLERAFDEVDFAYGALHRQIHTLQPFPVVECSFLQRNKAEAELLEDFFCRRFGRQQGFYFATWCRDIDFTAPVVEGQTVFECEGVEIYALCNGSTLYRNIALLSRDSINALPIIDYEVNDDGNTILTVGGEGADASSVGVTGASWFLAGRFASDELTLRWHTATVAEAKISFRALLEEIGEITIGGVPLTIGGDFVTITEDYSRPAIIPTYIDGAQLLVSEDAV